MRGDDGVDRTSVNVSTCILTKEGALLLSEGTGDFVTDILPTDSSNGLAFDDFLEMDFRTFRKRVLKEEPDVRLPELELGREELLTVAGDFRAPLISLTVVPERLGIGRSRWCTMVGTS